MEKSGEEAVGVSLSQKCYHVNTHGRFLFGKKRPNRSLALRRRSAGKRGGRGVGPKTVRGRKRNGMSMTSIPLTLRTAAGLAGAINGTAGSALIELLRTSHA
jgi:hypothetical protein